MFSQLRRRCVIAVGPSRFGGKNNATLVPLHIFITLTLDFSIKSLGAKPCSQLVGFNDLRASAFHAHLIP